MLGKKIEYEWYCPKCERVEVYKHGDCFRYYPDKKCTCGEVMIVRRK